MSLRVVASFGLALVMAMFSISATLADGTIYNAADFSVKILGFPDEVGAGKEYTLVLSAGSSTKGPAAKDKVSFEISPGGKIADKAGTALKDPVLDDNGAIVLKVSFSQAGPATLQVKVGDDATLTYRVQPGDSASLIAARFGDDQETLYRRNKTTIGNDPTVLNPGQILSVRQPAPRATFTTNVIGKSGQASPSNLSVSIMDPGKVKAGATFKISAVVNDASNKPVKDVEVAVGAKTAKTDDKGAVILDLTAAEKAGLTPTTVQVGGKDGIKIVTDVTVVAADLDKIDAKMVDGQLMVVGTDKFGNALDKIDLTIGSGGKSATVTYAPASATVQTSMAKIAVPGSVKDTVSGGGISGAGTKYTVKSGDSVSSICTNMGYSGSSWRSCVDGTMTANGLQRNASGVVIINVGQQLTMTLS